ncbi:hypothetical protein [Legionella spiritensis]|nr:hypothetical protein [Legionella spiritensis]SNV46901.1 Uncharacterised protein [Legionella spiritensis]
MTSQRIIEVVSYNPEWPILFEKGALPVKEALVIIAEKKNYDPQQR